MSESKRTVIQSAELWQRKKRRILGEILRSGEVRSSAAWVSVHSSSKEFLLTYESQGLVVSVNGGGAIGAAHSHAQDAATLAKEIVARGGIIMNGGRNAGVMGTSAKVSGNACLGVIFPELKEQANAAGKTVIVNAPTPRIELLATCAPVIVIFRGGLGTLMVLMRAIVHIRNRAYHPEQLPQLVFISDYWIGLLTTMINLGALPREFVQGLSFFHRIEQVIGQLPAPERKKTAR